MVTQLKRIRRRWRFGHHKPRGFAQTGAGVIGSPMRAEILSGRLTLQRAPTGQELCVTSLGSDAGHAQRLRELGLFEGQTVRVLFAGNPLICQVGDCRFGMCRRLADCIVVEPKPRCAG